MNRYYALEPHLDSESLPDADDEHTKNQFWDHIELEQGVWLTQQPGVLLQAPSEAPHAVYTFTWALLMTAHIEIAVTFVRFNAGKSKKEKLTKE